MKEGKVKEGKEKEIYIVRVVRRSDIPGETLVGTIEDVIRKRKKTFKTEEELLKWLMESYRK